MPRLRASRSLFHSFGVFLGSHFELGPSLFTLASSSPRFPRLGNPERSPRRRAFHEQFPRSLLYSTTFPSSFDSLPPLLSSSVEVLPLQTQPMYSFCSQVHILTASFTFCVTQFLSSIFVLFFSSLFLPVLVHVPSSLTVSCYSSRNFATNVFNDAPRPLFFSLQFSLCSEHPP